jgi:outer membrane protein OmpA-like peptidoglycan-associated protein
MRRVSVVVGLVVVGVLAIASTGCVSQRDYDTLLLRNREQNKLLEDKEMDIARLQERVDAMQARAGDAQRLLDEKDKSLADAARERDEVRKRFAELLEVYKKLAGRTGEGPIPGPVAIEIEQLAAEYPNLFEFDRATGRLRFASDITFDSGSNVVKPEARTALTKLAAILSSDVAKKIHATIIGHTDTDPVKKPTTIALLKELGKTQNNMGLSIARAESVAEILKAGGVEAVRIITQGMGETQSIADNRTADGKAKNRRVEIFLAMGA